jgi:hypothetical protein
MAEVSLPSVPGLRKDWLALAAAHLIAYGDILVRDAVLV